MQVQRIAIAGLAVFVLAGCSTIGDWFGFGSGAAKTRPAELVEFKATASMSRAWDLSVGAAGSYTFVPGSDGQAIYAVGGDGRLVKADPATGRELVRAEAGKGVSAGVGVGDGLVLVGTLKGEVKAFRAADLQPAWTAKLSGEILTAPVAGGGLVAVRANNGSVYLLDSDSGKTRWVYNRSQPALTLRDAGALAMDRAGLFAGHPGGKLASVALANGAPLWEVNVALPRGATELERIADVMPPLAMDERVVCAAAFQGRIGCFDRRSGQPAWARDLSALTGVEMDGSQVYVADEHAAVYAFDKQQGVNLWKQDKLRDRQASVPAALERWVAVGDYEGYVHLLNREDGAFAARIATDGSPIRAPMLILSRGVVVQTAKGGLYAFKIQ